MGVTEIDNLDDRINLVFSKDQFTQNQQEKEVELVSILKEQIENQITYSPLMSSLYRKLKFVPNDIKKVSDIPPLPVQMFKSFDLRTCPEENIIRVLNSSATTSGIPSKIYVDKATAFRQTKGLTTTTKNFIGKSRKPYLVIDEDVISGKKVKLSARGAAIRGFSNFAKKTVFIMDRKINNLILNMEKLEQFCDEFRDQEVLVFGFTYIIWSNLIGAAKKENFSVNLPNLKLLHGGGWKKLKEQSVSKELFNLEVAKFFNTKSENILDYYGMVEQLGVVFIDCEYGHKHVPDFAEIIIRDFYSMEELPLDREGLIECVSILPSSYPGQALLTEDVGKILGIDSCPCGRKGKYFAFVARAEKAEIRGCGDTFAEQSSSESTLNKFSKDNQESKSIKDEWDW